MLTLPEMLKPIARELAPLKAALIASMMITVLGIGSALLSRAIYDHVMPARSWTSLTAVIVGMLLVIVLDGVLRHLRQHFVESAGHAYDLRVGDLLFGRLMSTPLGRGPNSSMTTTLFGQLDAVRDMWSGALVSAVVDAVSVVVVLAVMAAFDPWCALSAAVGFGVILGMAMHVQRQLNASTKETAGAATARQGLLVESVLGLEDIKACRATDRFRDRMSDLTARSAAAGRRVRDWSGIGTLSSTVGQSVVRAAVTGIAAIGVIAGTDSQGDLIALMILSGLVTAPVSMLAAGALRVGRGQAAVETLAKFDAAPLERADGHTPVGPLPNPDGLAVVVQGVRVVLEGVQKPLLDGVVLDVAVGETIGLTGPMGAGKSTLGRVLAGLVLPTEGNLRVDGVCVSGWNLDALRQRVHYVGQAPLVFAGGVLENVRLARPDATEQEISRVLNALGALPWLGEHADGKARVLSERGMNLSGGQRKTLALARAFLADPDVLFLDEPTNDLDPDTRTRVALLVRERAKSGRTTIVATHALDVLPLFGCRRNVVMNNGKVVAIQPVEAAQANVINIRRSA